MGRKPRVEYEGAVYHAIQRGNNREYIFENDEDKLSFLTELGSKKRALGLQLFGYVVMGNHYHLLLQTSHSPLSRVMHRINGYYGRYYNRKHRRSGPVFESRYKTILIQGEPYLLAVLRYIHRNPVRAGICPQMSGYRWSSDRHYRGDLGGLVDVDLILGCLSNDRREAIRQYALLMEEEDESDYETVETVRDKAFIAAMNPVKTDPARKGLEEILAGTGAGLADQELIRRGSRKRHLVQFKAAYAKEAFRQHYTLKEIADYIGLSAAGVFRIIHGK